MTFRESCDTIMQETYNQPKSSVPSLFGELALAMGTNCALLSTEGRILYRVDPAGTASLSSLTPRCAFFQTVNVSLSNQASMVTCPCGYSYAVAPLQTPEKTLGFLLAGPYSFGEGNRCEHPELLCQQPRRTTQARGKAILHILNMSCGELLNHSLLEKWESEKQFSVRQSMSDGIRALKKRNAEEEYPVALEKDLQQAIVSHDVSRTRHILNRLLSHIFYQEATAHDTKIVLVRVLELLTLISRSALKAGADSSYILTQNAIYMEQGIEYFWKNEPIEDIALWLNGILGSYTKVFEQLSQGPHSDMLTTVKNYILANYMRKLSLEEISKQVFLTPAYLSRIFKTEVGIPFSTYLNQVRVEQSKYLLLFTRKPVSEIFALCGFEDQSYFTKVFRQITGVSPGHFREVAGNI